MKYFYPLTLIAFFFCSCERDTGVNAVNTTSYSYFPLDEKSWIIYNVDSVIHLTDDDFTNQPDTSIAAYHFQVKEVIDSGFTDGQGNEAFRVSRYKRLNDTLPWDFQAVWVACRLANCAQRVEENIRYVKLSFPVNIHATWNGNAYNDFTSEEYSYQEIHVPLAIGAFNFDSTVTVLQFEDNNLLHQIFKQEKYANHVGLVFQEKDSLNINGIQQVTNGIEYREIIQSYGRY